MYFRSRHARQTITPSTARVAMYDTSPVSIHATIEMGTKRIPTPTKSRKSAHADRGWPESLSPSSSGCFTDQRPPGRLTCRLSPHHSTLPPASDGAKFSVVCDVRPFPSLRPPRRLGALFVLRFATLRTRSAYATGSAYSLVLGLVLGCPPGGTAATRKPRCRSRNCGPFPLRNADRQHSASSAQLPPRITRFAAVSGPDGSLTSSLA